jgi:very-short-patch-repair endonuclease
MNPVDVRLAKLAASQHSVVTRQQALSLGMTPRQIDRRLQAGGMIIIHSCVYRVVGAPTSFEQAVLGACLSTGGVASHRTAAYLWGLRGIEDPPVEITVARRHRSHIPGVIIHRSELLTPADITRRAGIPLTKPARTILDLGAVAPQLVEGAAEDARFKRLVTVAGLWHIVDTVGAQGRGGSGVLRQLLIARDPGLAPTESALEDAICAVLRRFNLPEPARQHRVARPGRKPLRLDIAYPEALLDIEGDGERWHSGTRDFQRDRERTNYLVAHGWGILRFTWHDVRHRPAELAAQVEAVRAARLRAAG